MVRRAEWHPDCYWACRETDDDNAYTLSGSPGWCRRCRKVCWLTNTWSDRAGQWLLDEHNCREPPKHHS